MGMRMMFARTERTDEGRSPVNGRNPNATQIDRLVQVLDKTIGRKR